MGATAPFWRYSAASYPDLEGSMPVGALVGVENRSINSESNISAGVCNIEGSPYVFHPRQTCQAFRFCFLLLFNMSLYELNHHLICFELQIL